MTPYGYHWRTRIRPAILARDGHRCRKCNQFGWLDVAHVDGDNRNDADTNLLSLCRLDHRRLDYASWKAKSRETRAARKDAARPLLVMCG